MAFNKHSKTSVLNILIDKLFDKNKLDFFSTERSLFVGFQDHSNFNLNLK